MSGVVSGLCKGIGIMCDMLSLLDSSSKIDRSEGDEKVIRTASSINHLAMLVLQVAELVASSKGASTTVLLGMKAGEVGGRLINAVIKPQEAAYDSSTKWEYFEKGILAPMADLVRTTAQAHLYVEQRYIERLKVEPNVERPVYDNQGNIVDYKPVTEQECRDNIATLKVQAESSALARVAFEARVVSRVADSTGSIYESIINYFRVNQLLEEEGQYDTLDQLRGINLLDLPVIPPAFHEDVVFRRYCCSISYEPIRHVVADPTTGGRHLYELRNIERWIGVRHISPMSRRSLTLAQLQECPAMQALIDERLQFHQEHLQEYINANYVPQERLDQELLAADQ